MITLTFITGGARSGKSRYAEKLALDLYRSQKKPIAYLATGKPLDREFEKRIKLHQERRGEEYITREEPLKLDEAIPSLLPDHNIILVDCITTWLGNLFMEYPEEQCEQKAFDILKNLVETLNSFRDESCCRDLIIVSNELGMGLVPADAMSRLYRDLHGKVNQMIAERADRVQFVVSGIPLNIKG